MKKTLIGLLLLAGCSPDAGPTPPPVPPVSAERSEAAPPAEPAESKLPPAYAGQSIPFKAPEGWESEEPSNRLRVAQYKVPDKAGKAEAAEFVLSTTRIWSDEMRHENVLRWGQQMGVDDPKAETLQGRHKILLVDLKGTYHSDFAPEPIPKARMLVATVEPGGAPWFFKLIGPEETVSGWREEFLEMVKAAGP
jgi:hypothetical protein